MADEPQTPGGLSPSSSSSTAGAGEERPARTGEKGVLAFFRASWAELQRVRWPDSRQVGQGTAVVLVFTLIAGIVLGLVDAGAARIIDLII